MTVAEAGRRGGLKGGQSTSPAKVAAGRKSIVNARAVKALKDKLAQVQKALREVGYPGPAKRFKDTA